MCGKAAVNSVGTESPGSRRRRSEIAACVPSAMPYRARPTPLAPGTALLRPGTRGPDRDLEAQEVGCARRRRREHIGSVQVHLMVADHKVTLVASEHECRSTRLVGHERVLREIIRRYNNT